jgi:hypothetical protein
MPAAIWGAFEQRFQVRILEWYGAVEGGFVYIFVAYHRALPTNAMLSYLHVVSALSKTLSEKPQKRLLLERFDPSGPDVFMPSPSHTTRVAPSP